MRDFSYHRPATVLDACALGRRLASRAAFLAGGTELIPDYRRGRETATDLISLRGLTELRGIAVEGDALRIGSLTTVADVARSALVREWFPALWEAARALGAPAIRSRATVGGNFCRAVSCADLPPAALVAGATLTIASPDGTRELPAEGFFVDARRTVLAPGDLLLAVSLPRAPHASGSAFERFALRRGLALAVASVAARVDVDDGRVVRAVAALGAVAPTPMLVPGVPSVLDGQTPTPAMLALAAAACAEAARPVSDVRGSVQFRGEIVAVLARRALERALARATGGRAE